MGRKVTPQQAYDELMFLYTNLLIPFMKIRRDMPFPTEPNREETDGEHAFTLSMLALDLNEKLGLGLDSGLIAKYALVHDLVEVHAGDISVRADDNQLAGKAAAEAESLAKIRSDHADTSPWMISLIENYEARSDQESRFVYACDKLVGAFARIAGEGARWTEHYPEITGESYHRVVSILRKKAEAFPELLEFFDHLHNHLDKLRLEYHAREEE